ncbi:hypothetical protein J2X19_001302 [Rhodoferax ferrireducens]|uniref:Uncharacterized protein n=1 Tax=Rhodoferax ferrireducens TaxID=192843 RepID=A0ABU2C5N4_9BURK|nr:hypothetical protein [Rhodoferax ferrireducens]MDR7376644.1 hypothetical protein [Rhodoferax ferrireducens]
MPKRQQQVPKQLQQVRVLVQQLVLQPQVLVQELVLLFCRKQPKQQQPSELRVQAICSLQNSLRGRGKQFPEIVGITRMRMRPRESTRALSTQPSIISFFFGNA